MSQQDYRPVTNLQLDLIQILAGRMGYIEAVHQVLKLPKIDLPNVKQKAHGYYTYGPSSFYDAYLLERAWVKAICDCHGISVSFEIDLFVHNGRSLPEKPDNPT